MVGVAWGVAHASISGAFVVMVIAYLLVLAAVVGIIIWHIIQVNEMRQIVDYWVRRKK
jgi:hypothetical protein